MGSSNLSALVAALVVVVLVTVVEAQSPPPADCANKLVPCANYINSTSPPPSCCDPLKEAITNQLACLCSLYKNPQFLATFKINITQALQLPGRCKISGDLNSCVKASGPTSPSMVPPPATPGSNGVSRIAWTGMSSMLLFWASMMLY